MTSKKIGNYKILYIILSIFVVAIIAIIVYYATNGIYNEINKINNVTCTYPTASNCNGTCVNLLTDSNNCGHCGNMCPIGTTCYTDNLGITQCTSNNNSNIKNSNNINNVKTVVPSVVIPTIIPGPGPSIGPSMIPVGPVPSFITTYAEYLEMVKTNPRVVSESEWNYISADIVKQGYDYISYDQYLADWYGKTLSATSVATSFATSFATSAAAI